MKPFLKAGPQAVSLLLHTALAGIVCGAVILVSQAMGAEVTGMGALKLSSPAFKYNQMIPFKYTCDGADVNPPLAIESAPAGAKSLALVVDDPDAPAGTWVHWVLWNIDPGTTEIGENSVPSTARQGVNDFRKRSYGGPCPPSGTHRYFFKLYALDTVPDLGQDTTKSALERAMKGHIIAETELIGVYKRK
jgi:Raf kinase inhibitor-like YbhB/YbcL family protein